MAIMALDHTRDFFTTTGFNPRDVMEPALFLTRWITHFCAPTFIFLAGLSAFLYSRGRSAEELSRFLFIRGLWLILIDLTLIQFSWRFEVDLYRISAGVIFVIGVSMVVLAALVWLPRWAMVGASFIMVVGHNLLDSVRAEELGKASWAWHVLHETGLRLSATARDALHRLPAYPVDRGHGRWLFAWPTDAAGGGGEAAAFVWARCCGHARLYHSARHQPLWRSGAMGPSGNLAFDCSILSQL
jgi:uncharacterized membrane protein